MRKENFVILISVSLEVTLQPKSYGNVFARLA